MTPQRRRSAVRRAALAAVAAAAFCIPVGARAQPASPGPPDFAWPYGIVRLDGANIEPPIQPVIALVNGRACGSDLTRIAEPGPGTPPTDVGRTAYVVDVLADGQAPGQRPGCGVPGLPILLYFPALGRFALQQPTFAPGPQRLDLDLGPGLPYRLASPVVASDGTN
ncbi:hypothetical protein [Tepidiforma sp.]|uniref:hypothetical protein n=1 Tax=Tepidiforma sp. TaxID=2682230 RepID=UPI002ADD5843|nr:hypothetical protein [Tepidiforma sp.]